MVEPLSLSLSLPGESDVFVLEGKHTQEIIKTVRTCAIVRAFSLEPHFGEVFILLNQLTCLCPRFPFIYIYVHIPGTVNTGGCVHGLLSHG